MATTSTSDLFTRSWWLSNATGTPKSFLAASADSRRLVDSAVISKSSESDFKAGMCASAPHPRSGLAPMMPTRILLSPLLFAIEIRSLSKAYCLADQDNGRPSRGQLAVEYQDLRKRTRPPHRLPHAGVLLRVAVGLDPPHGRLQVRDHLLPAHHQHHLLCARSVGPQLAPRRRTHHDPPVLGDRVDATDDHVRSSAHPDHLPELSVAVHLRQLLSHRLEPPRPVDVLVEPGEPDRLAGPSENRLVLRQDPVHQLPSVLWGVHDLHLEPVLPKSARRSLQPSLSHRNLERVVYREAEPRRLAWPALPD